MSDVIEKAVAAMQARLGSDVFDGSVCFEITGEGSVRLDETGASASDADADAKLTADLETFEGLMDGSVDATAAFMSGDLQVDGDMSVAMKLGSLLS